MYHYVTSTINVYYVSLESKLLRVIKLRNPLFGNIILRSLQAYKWH